MPAAAAGIWRAGQVGMCRHQGYERGNMTGSKVTSLPPSPPISTLTSSASHPPPPHWQIVSTTPRVRKPRKVRAAQN